MQVFSPGRFLPAYWERFGLPDLAKEFEELDLRSRVSPFAKILTEEEFGRLKDEVNAVLLAWIDWRERAMGAGIHHALQGFSDPRTRSPAWMQWVDDHRGLKQEWDDLSETVDELQRHLEAAATLIDTREAEQRDSPARLATVPAPVDAADDTPYSPTRLAEMFNIKAEPLRKALERLRRRDLNCFIENENHAGNEPQYLYKLSSAMPIIDRMRKTDNTSNSRPG